MGKVVLVEEREGEIFYPYRVTCEICGRIIGNPCRTLGIAKAIAVRHLKQYHLEVKLIPEQT